MAPFGGHGSSGRGRGGFRGGRGGRGGRVGYGGPQLPTSLLEQVDAKYGEDSFFFYDKRVYRKADT